MSLVDGFKVVIALFVGLSCSAAWSKDPPAKSKTEAAQAEELRQEGVVTGAGQTIVVSGQATAVATAGGFAAGSISIDANGAKQVQAEEYGKKVKISEDPQNGIQIERITKKGGTDVTEKFEAKNVKELEKKFPEGFKLYNQYLGQGVAGGAGMGVIQGAGVLQAVPFPVPGAIPPGGFLPMPPPGGVQIVPGQGGVVVTATAVMAPAQLEFLNAEMQALNEGLKSFSKADKLKEAAQPAKDEAKKHIAELKKQLADLEKQLDAK